jgi:3-isopropylmalate/(R)-2-methylmalate dehydratase large subunit
VKFEGQLQRGVTAKDMILALIARIGVGGGTGHVLEYAGPAVRALSMEERMTLCNMSIEAGARAGMVAPDETTFDYLYGRPFAPQGAAWDEAVARWRELPSDPGASYDRTVTIDVGALAPMITYGTNPGMGMPLTEPVPDPAKLRIARPALRWRRRWATWICSRARRYWATRWTSSLSAAAPTGASPTCAPPPACWPGARSPTGVRMLVVPGSETVRRQAEAEGLDRIFVEAGAEWRYAGCSMCLAMNGDQLAPGQYAVSTTNRNFEGRQGPAGAPSLPAR